MSPSNRRVIHIEKDDSYITLGESTGGPVGPKPPTGGNKPPKPPTVTGGGTSTGGITPPTGVQPPKIVNPITQIGAGFQALWPTTVTFDYNQSISIAAQDAIDPYATAILPQWMIFLLPGEAASSAVWRYQMLQKKHPDWSPEKIASVIFGKNTKVPGWVVDMLNAKANHL